MNRIGDKTIFKISECEMEEVREIFSRKKRIRMDLERVADNKDLYNKLRYDYAAASKRFREWFLSFEKNYNIQKAPDCYWNVDFEAGRVELAKIPV